MINDLHKIRQAYVQTKQDKSRPNSNIKNNLHTNNKSNQKKKLHYCRASTTVYREVSRKNNSQNMKNIIVYLQEMDDSKSIYYYRLKML